MLDQHTRLKRLLQSGQELNIEEAREVVNHLYEHCRIDTRDRFHNVFFHEVCPLLLIAEHVGDSMTRIVFTGGDTRFDGIIILEEYCTVQKVEFTAAIDGYQDALRMELLAARGHAPAFRKIRASGTKGHRTFHEDGNADDAFEWAQRDQEMLRVLFDKALKLKVEKARTNPNYDGAWLGIVFDDWIMPPNDRKKGCFDPLCRRVLAAGARQYHPFSRVFFVGISRKYIFDSCRDRSAHATSRY